MWAASWETAFVQHLVEKRAADRNLAAVITSARKRARDPEPEDDDTTVIRGNNRGRWFTCLASNPR